MIWSFVFNCEPLLATAFDPREDFLLRTSSWCGRQDQDHIISMTWSGSRVLGFIFWPSRWHDQEQRQQQPMTVSGTDPRTMDKHAPGKVGRSTITDNRCSQRDLLRRQAAEPAAARLPFDSPINPTSYCASNCSVSTMVSSERTYPSSLLSTLLNRWSSSSDEVQYHIAHFRRRQPRWKSRTYGSCHSSIPASSETSNAVAPIRPRRCC